MSDDGMREPGLDPIAAVEVWRVQGAAHADPVRFCVIEALARRATGLQGEARHLLMRRIEELLAKHAAAQPRTSRTDTAPDEPPARRHALAGLSGLVERLGRATASPEMLPGTARGGRPSRPGQRRSRLQRRRHP